MPLAKILAGAIVLGSLVAVEAGQPQIIDRYQEDLQAYFESNGTQSLVKRDIYLKSLDPSRICGFMQGNLRFPLQCGIGEYCNYYGDVFQCCSKVATAESAYLTTYLNSWTYQSSISGESTEFMVTTTSTYEPTTTTTSFLSYGECSQAYTTCYDSTAAKEKSDGMLCTDSTFPKCATYLYTDDLESNSTQSYSAKMYFCDTQSYIMPIFTQGKSEITTTSNSDYEGLRTTVGNDDQNTLAGPTSTFSMAQSSRDPAGIITAPTVSSTALSNDASSSALLQTRSLLAASILIIILILI